MHKKNLFLFLFFWVAQSGMAEIQSQPDKQKDVTQLDMADLLNVKVTSVSKKAQALSDAPSAIFVISSEDIKRSGVTNVPEALRMVPGIDVARINSNKWAITSRGFNGSSANKLLVLIDGRSVYTPAFSGVYWDAQDVMIEDIDRIEVIRGPGATLWGANAVNGVINIITKDAEKTQGGLLTAGGGSYETGFGSLRYGKKLGDDTYGRIYAKGFQRDNFKTSGKNTNAGDDWSKQQGGFRIDSRLTEQDELTLQGDLYHTDINQTLMTPNFIPPTFNQTISDQAYNEGWNITSRLRHKYSTTAEYILQFYYDHTRRNEFFSQQSLDTFDIDFQNSFELTDSQDFIWGLGYRTNMDQFNTTQLTALTPSRRNTQLFSAFLQDEFTLVEDALWLTIGSKFEHNDYTGFEGQPTARLMWAPSPKQRVWAAFSRSVRTPARAEQDVDLLRAILPSPPLAQFGGASLPMEISINGNKAFQSEVELTYELGYRFTFSPKASFDFAAFYNDYDKLRDTASLSDVPTFVSPGTDGILQPHLHLPLVFQNTGKGRTYGFSTSTIWQMSDWWRWDLNYSFLKTEFAGTLQVATQPVSPQNKVSLRALINPADNINFDLWLRYNSDAIVTVPTVVGGANTTTIKGYVTLDARLAWKPMSNLELSLVGQNLLADRHLEYVDEVFVVPSEIPRSVYGKIAFDF
ncbi:MAG: TonB-dependent receptor [Methylococcaceae bacterium]|nr:TonB-dependent receptor [Methylococcaceae bacterium]